MEGFKAGDDDLFSMPVDMVCLIASRPRAFQLLHPGGMSQGGQLPVEGITYVLQIPGMHTDILRDMQVYRQRSGDEVIFPQLPEIPDKR